jgi:oxygen-dependent protoporphyrinogen oxidase
VLDNLFAPFVSGIYAGNPAQMSMKASFPRLVEWEQTGGSIIKGMLASRKSKKSQPPPPYERPKSALLSFEQGMAALPMALFHSLPKTACQLGASVTSIQKVDTGYSIQVDNQPQSIETRTLILATPAYATQSLLGTMPGGDSLSLLLDIPYAAIHAVHVGLPKRALPHPLDGFGYLIPRTQGITLLGSIWSSSLFPNRAPQGMALLTNFIGGMHYPEIAHWRPAQVEQQVLSDLARIFKVNDLNPSLVKVTAWPRAIPQYTLGHVERVSQLESVVTSTLPGVFLTGNYLRGVSVNDTIKAARACVDKALDFMGDKATSAYALFS